LPRALLNCGFKKVDVTFSAFKLIVTACMRKLLTILNVMLRENQSWSPKGIA